MPRFKSSFSFQWNIPDFLKTPLLISAFLSASMMLGFLSIYTKLQPVVPIFYSLALPAQHLAHKAWLLTFPTLSLFITLSHAFILNILYQKDAILLQLFAWMSIVLQTIILLGLLRIIIIIT